MMMERIADIKRLVEFAIVQHKFGLILSKLGRKLFAHRAVGRIPSISQSIARIAFRTRVLDVPTDVGKEVFF